MKRARSAAVRTLPSPEARRPGVIVEAATVAGQLGIARIAAVERGEAGAAPSVSVRLAGRTLAADVDPAVDVEVLETALEHRDPVIVVTGERRPTIVGALRTRATPGVDAMDHVAIRARTVEVEAERFSVHATKVAIAADDDITLRAAAAYVALRAAGEIESFAERIVARAEGVHKLVGRMLRLN